MTLKRNAIGLGTQTQAASALIGGCQNAQTATGTTQATAFLCSSSVTEFTTVASNSGAQLPLADPGDWAVISAQGANDLKVYGQTGENIDAGAANAAYTHTSKYLVRYIKISATQWRSFKGSAVSG